MCEEKMDKYPFEQQVTNFSCSDEKDGNISKCDETNDNERRVRCDTAGCGLEFPDVESYDSHQQLAHQHMCRECRRVMPTNHLLHLHVLEMHDQLFPLLAQKQPMYQCLLPSCEMKMSSPESRKDHMISVHKYPSNFRFDIHRKRRKKKTKLVPEKYPSKPHTDQNDKKDVESSEGAGGKMEVVENEVSRSLSAPKRNVKVPANFSFGQGVAKTFMRGGGGRGRCKKSDCGWHHKLKDPKANTEINIEEVSMRDLEEHLHSS